MPCAACPWTVLQTLMSAVLVPITVLQTLMSAVLVPITVLQTLMSAVLVPITVLQTLMSAVLVPITVLQTLMSAVLVPITVLQTLMSAVLVPITALATPNVSIRLVATDANAMSDFTEMELFATVSTCCCYFNCSWNKISSFTVLTLIFINNQAGLALLSFMLPNE